jgi:hypothetical protein
VVGVERRRLQLSAVKAERLRLLEMRHGDDSKEPSLSVRRRKRTLYGMRDRRVDERREVKIANRPSACGWQASKGASLLWK